MRRPFPRFLVRWLVCALGLWVSAGLLGTRLTYGGRVSVLLIAGLILAIVNVVIKPIVIILSLPAILLSLGLFMIVINGLMVFLVSKLYDSLFVANFGTALLAGIIIGLVNYLVTAILEET
jgi:putative membrane protein